jgi:hypothetical protein
VHMCAQGRDLASRLCDEQVLARIWGGHPAFPHLIGQSQQLKQFPRLVAVAGGRFVLV